MSKSKQVICLVNLCLTLLIYLHLFAAESIFITTKADGIADIVGENTAIARNAAINNALKKAVEYGVETIVSAEIISTNSQLLDDNIYSEIDDYISNYKILSEKATGNLYQVTIEANVETGKLKTDLTILNMVVSRNNMPKVLIMIAEKKIGQTSYNYWWGRDGEKSGIAISGRRLKKILIDKEFQVIDYSVMPKYSAIPDLFKVDNLTNSSIQAIGNFYDADIVIYGKALAGIAGSEKDRSINTARADVSLIAVDTRSGEVIASAKNHEWAGQANAITAGEESLAGAIDGIGKDFLSQIAAALKKETNKKTKIKMVISNIKSFADFVKFKKILLNKIPGVEELHQLGFSEGSALLELEMNGSSQKLSDELTMTEYNGYTVDITGLTQNSIKLEMRSLP